MVFLRLSLLALIAAALSSCALAPAKLQRLGIGSERGRGEQSLGPLLEKALIEKDHRSTLALAQFIEQWKRSRGAADQGEVSANCERNYQVRFTGGVHGGYPLSYFDEISPAADYRVKKIDHLRRPGIGAPLVALRENRGRSPIEKFYPPEAITRPLTAVIASVKTQDEGAEVDIQLLCPLQNDEVRFGGKSHALAADFTVPWAALLSRAGKLNRSQYFDILTTTPSREPQLYLMEPYDPNKEPLIMIHGLLDTSLAFAKLSNELWADDTIRRRYQIWHYLYNTSAPALYSGRILSTQLRELRQLLDPSGQDRAMRSTTIIAHSMGGIVSRRLLTRPGNVFWNAAFHQPIETLELRDTDRKSLTEAFFWDSEKHVRRVIYMAVPHRGSDYADGWVGKLGRWLVKPPNLFAAFYDRISRRNPGAFTEAYAQLGSGSLDSVNALSPKQPTLKILAKLPNNHPVSVHSIIGNQGKPGPIEESSDGIVPYWSSHLPDAASEKIVPSTHGLIDHQESVSEIKRILKSR